MRGDIRVPLLVLELRQGFPGEIMPKSTFGGQNRSGGVQREPWVCSEVQRESENYTGVEQRRGAGRADGLGPNPWGPLNHRSIGNI